MISAARNVCVRFPPLPSPAYACPLPEQADKVNGLPTAEVDARKLQYGPNALEEASNNMLLKFLGYFYGPMPIMIW
jgi:hypothetical protein